MAKPRTPKKTADAGSTTASPSMPNPTAAAATLETAVSASSNIPDVRKTVRKPEIVRNEARSEARPNLVPINLEDEIRRLAYLYSERRGFTPGHETEDWLAAEGEVRQRYHQGSVQQSA
jgi:hypothetical protein